MTANTLNIIASLLLLAGLVLLVLGLPDNSLVWQLGLGSVTLAMLVAVGTRFTEESGDEDGEAQQGDQQAEAESSAS